MLEVAILYGFDLSQVFTPIMLRLYQPHSLCEKGATKAAAKAVLYVFLLPPLREGRQRTNSNMRHDAFHFYSRPYVRGDRYLLKLRVSDDISTRAPTRGATSIGIISL